MGWYGVNALMLTRYGRLGASSRMRFAQYLPWLEAAGWRISAAPLFSDGYVRGLQENTRSPLELLRAYTGRARALLGSHRFDLLWIEKETLPWLPAWLEQALLSNAVPYVLDYDDAVFHSYDQHRSPWVRCLLAGKHPALMRGAALVVAGNPYLADFAQAAGARRVEVVPTVVDMARYPVPASSALMPGERPTVGWIGQRTTARFLTPLVPVFQALGAEGRARFTAVGIDAAALGLPMASVPWAEDTEVASISGFDVGIMPLVDEPFERGKCGYKLIQYMACGLPVVASPVGVNSQIVEHGVNGFLAETTQQWAQALRTLAADPALRARMGQAGRRRIEREYCLQVTGPLLAALLKAAAST
jgi:glycosyltransferase involved in cell wall biosynthesis